jgi:hypothetical protein
MFSELITYGVISTTEAVIKTDRTDDQIYHKSYKAYHISGKEQLRTNRVFMNRNLKSKLISRKYNNTLAQGTK